MQYNLNDDSIDRLRAVLLRNLKDYHMYNPYRYVKLNIDHKLLERLIFDKEKSKLLIPMEELKKIDLTGVIWDNVNVKGLDFSGSRGVVIDPQKVAYKSLRDTKLSSVTLNNNFTGVDIVGTDFSDSIMEFAIVPTKVKNKSLENTKLKDALVVSNFKGVCVENADFTGVRGNIELDPQTIKNKSLEGTILNGVTITNSFDGVSIGGTSFAGSFSAIINPQTVKDKNMNNTVLSNTEIFGSFDEVSICGADFTGSVGAYIVPDRVFDKDISGTIFTDSVVVDSFVDVKVDDKTDFSRCKMIIPKRVSIGEKDINKKINNAFVLVKTSVEPYSI